MSLHRYAGDLRIEIKYRNLRSSPLEASLRRGQIFSPSIEKREHQSETPAF